MAKAQRAWQRMLSGRRLDLLNPTWSDVEIEDIAHGLSRVARWNGQTEGDWAYSVADHSVLVTRIAVKLRPNCSYEDRLIALLHDAPEYVIGDLISPFKAMIGGDYKTLEAKLFEAVLVRFGLPAQPRSATMKWIKQADKVAAYLEAVTLAGFSEADADKIFSRPADDALLVERPAPQSPSASKQSFLSMFSELLSGRDAA